MIRMKISVCTFQNGDFEVMIQDESGEEVVLSGHQKLSEEQLELVTRLAPACVLTTYVREDR